MGNVLKIYKNASSNLLVDKPVKPLFKEKLKVVITS